MTPAEVGVEVEEFMDLWDESDHVGEQPFAALVTAALDQPNPTRELKVAILAVLKAWDLNPEDVF